jgi:hypothetical protein
VSSAQVRNPEAARLIARELQVGISTEARTLYFHGESMRPFLGEGDEVVVTPVAFEDIRIGDVVTYRYRDRFPTRRLMRRLPDRLVMWCENWPNRYFETRREDVLGLATARKRDGQWITARDSEWRAARRSALVKYWRMVAVPRMLGEARAVAGRFLRWTGLRKPLPARDAGQP